MVTGSTAVYLVRHAQAAGNLARVFQGHIDGAVSATGERQLAHLRERFAAVALDAVYTSPLSRAAQTAAAVSGGRLPLVTLPALMEIDGGAFEGVPFAALPERFPDAYALWDNDPAHFTAPGGESAAQVSARMCDTIREIARRHPGGTVAVVSHGFALRCYCCHALGMPLARLAEVAWCDNTAVGLVHYDETLCPQVEFLGDNSHLSATDSTFAQQDWWQKIPAHSTSATEGVTL